MSEKDQEVLFALDSSSKNVQFADVCLIERAARVDATGLSHLKLIVLRTADTWRRYPLFPMYQISEGGSRLTRIKSLLALNA